MVAAFSADLSPTMSAQQQNTAIEGQLGTWNKVCIQELDDNCDANFPVVIGCSHLAQIVTDDESVYKNSEVLVSLKFLASQPRCRTKQNLTWLHGKSHLNNSKAH